jgi:hypothetical protein
MQVNFGGLSGMCSSLSAALSINFETHHLIFGTTGLGISKDVVVV